MAGRFLIGIVGVIGKRLTYFKLITEGGSHELPTTGTWRERGQASMRTKPEGWRKPFGGFGANPLQRRGSNPSGGL